ncbi:hypothetical protein Metvu_1036 [Methanocaldococcus vulcanius M7]|uniref:Uncharacterized protein n=1 Tax=Methanocaldococcus vulcanius (strain ATCC 700851 / DSM 12094 / M7) TaxID=579137 RepID=C9RH42_METVM|nr:hypothetical protein [Methanocaldococcus vulcanius]ACX72894.1 hypothetical protein Metvu_1036 [Methanocaldococcus vulcanius M7]
MIDPALLRREVMGFRGKLANLIRDNKKVVLAGAGGLTAGYLANEMLSSGETQVYRIKRNDGTLIEKIVKKEDGSVNYLGIFLIVGILGAIWYFFVRKKKS